MKGLLTATLLFLCAVFAWHVALYLYPHKPVTHPAPRTHLQTARGAIVGPQDSPVNLRINVQQAGCTDGPSPCLQRAFTLETWVDGVEGPVISDTLDLYGEANEMIPAGSTLEWRLTVPGWLNHHSGADGSLAGAADFPIGFQARAGDINCDNLINAADFIALKLAFGTQPGDPGWNPDADLDINDTVGASDFLILRGGYGLGGEP